MRPAFLIQSNGGRRHDTRERFCCDGRCYQGNPSQGGSCPALREHEPVHQAPTPAERRATRQRTAFWIVASMSLLAALLWVAKP